MGLNTYLIVEKTGRVVPLDKQLEIGRGLSEEGTGVLKFPEPEISRCHAIIRKNEFRANWMLIDKSKKGTWVDDSLVRDQERGLRHGSKIRIGPHSLVFCNDIEDTMECPIEEQQESESDTVWFELFFGAVVVLFIIICMLFLQRF